MSNIVILIGSNRKNGNTDILAQRFAEGAREHNNIDTISIADLRVNPCIGCNSCFQNDMKCFQNDDMGIVYDKLSHADILVIASPVYFYGLSSQLKAVIDRLHNPIRDTFKTKKLVLLLVGAASLPEMFDGILCEYQLCLNFFKLEDGGKILVRGVKEKGDILNKREKLEEAYKLGLSIE